MITTDTTTRSLAIGLVLSMTFIAFEALAVITIMPQAARDLGQLSLYGWVFSGFMLGSVVGTVAAGRAADRRGPRLPYLAGLLMFMSGLLVDGLAPSMPVLVTGRLLQGVGAGAVPAVAYIAIARRMSERQRVRMLALLSTAWLLPGMVGPVIAAEVAHALGWRWVFLGLMPLVAIAGALTLASLAGIGPGAAEQTSGHRLRDAVYAAGGCGLLLAWLSAGVVSWAIVLGLAGVALAGPALRRLLPRGTLRGRHGLPATILSLGLMTFAFFGTDAFVPLAITSVLHRSTSMASVIIAASTVAWTVGSWLQVRLGKHTEERDLVRMGMFLLSCAIVGTAAVVQLGYSVIAVLATWSIGGLGMGLAFAPVSLLMMREAPAGREGWASASLNLSEVLGTALGTGAAGAAVAAAARLGWPMATGVTVAFCVAAIGAIAVVVLSRGLPLRGMGG
jgi:MFS family permease